MCGTCTFGGQIDKMQGCSKGGATGNISLLGLIIQTAREETIPAGVKFNKHKYFSFTYSDNQIFFFLFCVCFVLCFFFFFSSSPISSRVLFAPGPVFFFLDVHIKAPSDHSTVIRLLRSTRRFSVTLNRAVHFQIFPKKGTSPRK